jgi:ribose 5-phosphate isomerase B
MNISIGSDHSGFELKKLISDYLKEKSYEIYDVGTFSNQICDYPDYASLVCQDIIDKKSEIGILICGTGIGMSIASNRYKNIRAALCTSEYMAKKAKEHNNANIIILGAKLQSHEDSLKILDEFLQNNFEGGRHNLRLSKIS